MQAMNEPNEMGCDEFADVAAELALGVLTGRERAAALAHLDRCDTCRENVRQLTMTSEELLGLLPASEPPPGFETRVMERLGLVTPSPAPVGQISQAGRAHHFGWKLTNLTGKGGVSRTRRMLATAAVALAVIVSGLGGWGLRGATPSPSPLSSAALLSASHQMVGTIYFYDGSSRWLYMSVNMDSETGTVICQVEGPDGHVTTLGSFRLAGGQGYWGSPDPANNGRLTGARLISTDGTVLATASFPET
jgi:anti-sigma-K factor RskA